MREPPEFQYDVFLSHNSKDKHVVRELKRRLSAKGLIVWFDEDELRPGVPWQQLLEAGIRASKSVAVLVGKDGIGPWENEEMQAALILAVERKRPVIPILMPDADSRPTLPMFLGNRTWVILERGLEDHAVAQVIWGATGAKPDSTISAKVPLDAPVSNAGRRLLCRLSCREKGRTDLHLRPMAFLDKRFFKNFPETEFYLMKQDESENLLGRPANMRSAGDILLSSFHHGDAVVLEVRGKMEVLAAGFLKIALENLDGYTDDPVATTKRIGRLIDDAALRLYDPDLDDLEQEPITPSEELLPVDLEHRSIAVINDRLHDVSLPMIPLIAKYFGCGLQIGFELPEKGVYFFGMGSESGYQLDKRIADLDVPVGTKVTIVTCGDRAQEAGASIRNVLQNLWQCDHWIRGRAKDWDTEAAVSDLLEYAKEMARNSSTDYAYVQSPFISNLITQSVVVNPPGQSFTKRAALKQLAELHAKLHDLRVSEILRRVEDVERRQTVVPRPGFAIAHAAMDRSPRISISFGVYPDGLTWSEQDGIINLVAMVICAQDTYKTWLDYLRRFSILFRAVPTLQQQLVSARTKDEFVRALRSVEISLAKT